MGVGLLRGGGDYRKLKSKSFKASKCLGFVVSWFLGFFVSKFPRYQDSKVQKLFNLMEDIDPILSNYQFVFSGR